MRYPELNNTQYLCLLIAGLVFSATVNAAEFHMQDDSVVYGSILRLVDGQDLVVDTAHMGEVTLEWDALKRIEGTRIVEVEFFNGTRVLGSLELDGEGLLVRGDQVLAVDPASVYAISEVKPGVWDAFGAYTDLGLNIVRGNSRVTQLSFGAGVSYDVPGIEMSIDAATFRNEQIEAQDTRRTTLSANYTMYLDRGWSLTGLYEFEGDEQQGLDGRSVLGAAVGKRILNNRAQRLGLFAGLAHNSEDLVDVSDQESSETLFGVQYRLRSTADIDATVIHFQNTEQSDRYRVQSDATLTMDLIANFDLNITAYNRYDSKPPNGIGRRDYGLVLGLRWEK
ncbi:MAG: DUF481 domain-containing protein [Gammaproteobacteria bacterium]|nr:DUF481 domain-containing protein [Gammaproteobacteria bacterium]